jgi:hypothetical protein
MKFERPTAMTFATQASTGAFYNKFLSKLEAEIGAIEEAQAALAAAVAAQAAADAADTKARQRMDDLPDVTILGDYTGAIDSSQFPIEIAVKRFDGTTNVSASSTWTATVESGDASVSIGAATGILSVNSVTTRSVVRIESTKDGLTLRKKQVIPVDLASPPNTGSGASSWTDTTLASINSTTHAPISDELTVTVGASGTVTLSAPLGFSPDSSVSLGTYKVWGKWQWWNGAAWADLAAEVQSNPDSRVYSDEGARTIDSGTLSVSDSKSGLAPAASEKFRLMARNDTGTAVISFGGTATATS